MIQRVSVFASWSACFRMQLRAILCPVPARAGRSGSRAQRLGNLRRRCPRCLQLPQTISVQSRAQCPKSLHRKHSSDGLASPQRQLSVVASAAWPSSALLTVVVAVLWWENEDVVRLNHDWRSAAFELDRHALMWRWRRAQDDATPTVELVVRRSECSCTRQVPMKRLSGACPGGLHEAAAGSAEAHRHHQSLAGGCQVRPDGSRK